MIVYKVVSKQGEIYTSSNIRVFPYKLTYQINKRTSASKETAGVFVFKTKGAAIFYANALGRYRTVLKAKTDKRYIKEFILVCGWTEHRYFSIRNREFWTVHPPEETFTVPSIIPLKELT